LAREFTVEVRNDREEVSVQSSTSKAAVGTVLHILADRVCVHAVQEVFANEVTIRAGFADALYHLDLGIIDKARQGSSNRSSLAQSLDRQVRQKKLSAERAAALLLIGDLQAHLPLALETAPFLRAGVRRQAEGLEAALVESVWSELDPTVQDLYRKFRDHYLLLTPAMSANELESWSKAALDFLADALRDRNMPVCFALARVASGGKLRPVLRSRRPTNVGGSLEHEGGVP
jgi:hypothetical protein